MIKILKITTLLICQAAILFTACDGAFLDISDGPYQIGDTGPGGGIVFYISDDLIHGLEAAPQGWNDPDSHMEDVGYWSDVANVLIGTTGKNIGTGFDNSEAIINQPGHTESLAKDCRDYRGGGKDDWFLPAIDELELMYENLYLKGIGDFETSEYASSSEESKDYFFYYHFFYGYRAHDIGKHTTTCYARAVRAF